MSALEVTLTMVRDALSRGDAVAAAAAMTGINSTLRGMPSSNERDLYASCSELLRKTMNTWRDRAAANGAARAAIQAYREDL